MATSIAATSLESDSSARLVVAAGRAEVNDPALIRARRCASLRLRRACIVAGLSRSALSTPASAAAWLESSATRSRANVRLRQGDSHRRVQFDVEIVLLLAVSVKRISQCFGCE